MFQKSNNPTQKEEVFAVLRQGRYLTPLQALKEFGSLRLGAIIYNLRKEGYKIITEDVLVPSRNGKKKRVARYHLDPDQLEKGTNYSLEI